MAKALVFEGCPACEAKGFAGYGKDEIVPYATKTLTGGAIGAGGVIAVDMLLPKVLPTVSPFVRSLLTLAGVVGTAFFIKERYPDIAAGLAVGGGSIAIYKIVGSVLGKVVSSPAVTPVSGLGYADSGSGISIEESPYGVLVPEELGQEEIIIE